jgi:hypothetical protein
LGSIFAKAGSSESDELPEADMHAFSELLTAEVGQLLLVLDNVSDFGAFATALGVCMFEIQAAGCDHLKNLVWVNHKLPSIEDVQRAAQNWACQNVSARFLKRFWMEAGGHVLAFEEATKAT